MRVVVDSNRIQSEELERFLASAAGHRAVVTDWLMMEAYKGETRKSIYRSLGILAKFPRQVIVLRNTGMCMRQRVGPQMANRLIWTEHTDTFPQFIAEVADARAGNALVEESLLWRGQKANDRMEALMESADWLMDGHRAMATVLTPQDISAIRTGKDVPHDILNRVFEISDSVSQGFREALSIPTPRERGKRHRDDFLFRVGVSTTASFLEWVRSGSPPIVKSEKLRNDYVDSMLTVFGTYFNGVMSGDKRLQAVQSISRELLRKRGVNPPAVYAASLS